MESTLSLNPQPLPLADEPWFAEMLSTKGFSRASDNTFTNGKTLIQVDGRRFAADPGVGDSIFRADFDQADRQTVMFMVDQILKMRPFFTEAQLAQERAEKKRVNLALTQLALSINEAPETDCGVQLRRFLWSLFNMHHLVNLWHLTRTLDEQRAAWVTEVFTGALTGLVTESDLKLALQTAGEMERWDQEQSGGGNVSGLTEVQDAETLIGRLVRLLPPGRPHTVLVTLLAHIVEAQRELQRDNRPQT